MQITLVTLFPEWFTSPLSTALLGRAGEAGLLQFRFINPRDWAQDRHRSVDDRPYGGGPGMVMMPEPLIRALRAVDSQEASVASVEDRAVGDGSPSAPMAKPGLGRVIMLSAAGKALSQSLARELATEPALTLICGRYEGIDARLGELQPLEEVSVGEAVLNGGEAAAMMIIEAAARLIPGFMGKEASGEDESFSAGLLEYPQYTRPEVFEGLAVPELLLSGDHARIRRWRRERSLLTTLHSRPDLLAEAPLSDADMGFLRDTAEAEGRERAGRNLHCALVHYPVLLGDGKRGASSLTNLDVHDIARCSRSYGLKSFTVVTPLLDQRSILESLVEHWTKGPGGAANPDRAQALSLVEAADSIEETLDRLEARTGQRPALVGTSARDADKASGHKVRRAARMTPGEVRALLRERPVLLLFGTGHGMAPEVLDACDGILRPLRWMDAYNHLPVRGAVAVTLDRVLGDVY